MKRFLLLAVLIVPAGFSFAQNSNVPDKNILMQYFEKQEFAQSAAYLRPIVQADSSNLHTISLLGYTYYMSNQLARAEKCYLKIWDHDSSDLTACNYLGNINLKKSNYTLALHYFCRLVDLKPGVAAYYKELAYTWVRLFNSSAAEYYFRLAYFGNPDDPQVVASLADYWLQQKMFVRSDSILDVALQRDSLDAGLIEEKIKSAFLQNKYDIIFPLVDRLKRMNVIDLNSFLYGAYGYYYLRKYQPCVEICDFLITHGYQTQSVLFIEAMAFKNQKRYDLSLATLNECIMLALDKKANDYFFQKADIYQLLKQFDHAKSQYDTAYYIFHSPLMIYYKAVMYDVKLKKPRIALRYYRLYLRDVDGKPAKGYEQIFDYVATRVKQIEDWEKESKK